MDYARLSKEVSYALRHAPWEYELEMDEEGWVGVEQLSHALHFSHPERSLLETDFVRMIELSDKKRFEVLDGRIRAMYGHSIPHKIKKSAAHPPDLLYHGTSRRIVDQIRREGLRPMARQYVHLSADQETAMVVGRRKDNSPVMLVIDAARAAHEGTLFYHGNHTIWLADSIAPQYISE
ncbi:RNA 2'-phosphotransferase [Paenibacillus alvei]|uniref:Probable RNA 2'-phosphotransferase n=1 Tax=Paenibacillus alvei TaxID=44250 RepID=A0A383R801_PAEAL|nr:RNA 2'-phosphotransferase [Paenibacillus alvei]SYX82761.1 putative RNA 2'-phosphotransferase [Paenibacillus alvei]